MKSGNLNFLEPSEPQRPVTGLFTLTFTASDIFNHCSCQRRQTNNFPASLHAEIIGSLQDLNKQRVAEHSEIVTLNTCPRDNQTPRLKCVCAYRRRYWSYLLQLRTLTKFSVDSLTTARLLACGCQFSIKLCLLFCTSTICRF